MHVEQVKNPLTALRTFGKLLLRRLPPDDTLNRELAKDILLQVFQRISLLKLRDRLCVKKIEAFSKRRLVLSGVMSACDLFPSRHRCALGFASSLLPVSHPPCLCLRTWLTLRRSRHVPPPILGVCPPTCTFSFLAVPAVASCCGLPPISTPCDRQSDRVVDLLLPIDAVIGLLGQAVDTADTAAINNAGGGLAGGGTHPHFDGLAAAAPSSSSPSVSSNPGGDGVEPFSRAGGEGREAESLPWSVSQGATTPYSQCPPGLRKWPRCTCSLS